MNELPVFVIPDIHGNLDALTHLLTAQGILDQEYKNCITVQLGDLANCVRESEEDDLACLETVGKWIDVYLVGNHEYGHITGRRGFSGFFNFPSVGKKVRELDPQPCYEAYGWFLSHAGLSKDVAESMSFEPGDDVEVICAMIGDMWDADYSHDLFSSIGRARGGWQEQGGILWSDYREPHVKIKQVYGHTPGKEIRYNHPIEELRTEYCIDLGVDKHRHAVDRIAYAWIYPDGSIKTGVQHLC